MKVMLGLPSPFDVHMKTMLAVMSTIVDYGEHTVHLHPSSSSIAAFAKNSITRSFLMSDSDYLLLMDSDNPPLRNPLELVDADRDIISLPTPIYLGTLDPTKHFPIVWNVAREGDKRDGHHMADFHNGTTQMHGLEDVELSGAGCVLLSRKVCEKMHPLWRWDIDKKDGMPAQGDDFAFCRRARRLGFKVWCAWDYPCQHFRGEVDMLSLLLGHHNQMRLQKTEQEKTRILVP